MKNKIQNKILIILLVLNLCFTGTIGCYLYISEKNKTVADVEQYVMYVGTNDKDTYTQLITTEEAKEKIESICFKYIENYTIQEATGSYVNEKGIPTHENTIVCYFDGADKENVYKIADEIIKELNQSTVLIEKQMIQVDYYSRK